MTNTALLKEKLRKSGLRLRYVAEQMGITYQALHNKIENKTEFRQDEIRKLQNILVLTHEDMLLIFFS